MLGRTLLHGRRMERQERKRTAGNADELSHRLLGRNDGELVPATGHGASQRRGGGRRVGTRRLPGGTKEDEAMVPARIGLRATPAGRIGNHPVDRFVERDPTQLDRPERRHGSALQGERQRFGIHDIYHPCRHDVRGHFHGIGSGKRTGVPTDH